MIPSVAVTIFTYNRPLQFREVVRSLMEDQDAHRVHLLVMDDASPTAYAVPMIGEVWPYSGEVYRSHRNHGKRGFYHMWNHALRILEADHIDRFIFLPDDFLPVPGFLGKLEQAWQAVPTERRGTLSFFYAQQMRYRSNWTSIAPRHVAENLHLTQWVDGAFTCDRNYLEALKWRLHPIPDSRWAQNTHLGSGVGQQMSVRGREANLNMYHLHRNLVQPMDCDSQMNPNIRKQHPLT